MKTCSTCGNSFSDDLSFCLQDGTKLPDRPTLDHTNRPTEILRPETNENNDISTAETIVSESNAITPPPKLFQMSAVEPSKRMGCVLTIGQVAAGLIVVVGLGLAGLFFALRTSNDVARLDPPKALANNPSANAVANSMANAANFSINTASTPPPKTANRSPKTIPGGVLNARAIEVPEPIYPPAARTAGASGTVSVQVLIDESGRVVTARAVIGHPLLRSAAEQAARSARFSPTLLGGESVKVSGVINYNFIP